MTAASPCRTCGNQLREGARFCDACGSLITGEHAEYKQVTVLFADVVRSMEIAATVGSERLREIMTDLVNKATTVVHRYGGTVDKFTGDGIMALFGAPRALEDHAIRACLAALEIQTETQLLAVDVERRDCVELQLRIGLNSGQVIAGEIGSSSLGYTAVGEHVGMAQRMESIAAPGAVMLSASTARLVEEVARLAEPSMVHVKGAVKPVLAQRLLGISAHAWPTRTSGTTLVGRTDEMNILTAIFERSMTGPGAVASVVGPAGIGKTRLVREAAKIAHSRAVDVFTGFCESHTRQVPFHLIAQLVRACTGVNDLDDEAARAQIRTRVPDAADEDLLLLFDVLGFRDPDVSLPNIDPDAGRRRLSALINSISLAHSEPMVYVIEDAHWIDEVSESLVADLLNVIPRMSSLLMLITYRSDYRGVLAHVPGAETISLAPLADSEITALLDEILGVDPSVAGIKVLIAGRASGHPFFAEEMVRDLAERGVLQGRPGVYLLKGHVADVDVPATLQATIGARIDRLGITAKRALNAAAVIGSRFDADLLTDVADDADVAPLIEAELVDDVGLGSKTEYVFRHPLICAVAYESQLRSDRARLHRRLAARIEERDPTLADANAVLIAEHLEAAGDLQNAYAWHMRAGAWSTSRDIRAARMSWSRARHVADTLTATDPDRTAMGIAPRTLLCGSAWRVNADIAEHFQELRALCAQTGDKAALVLGMTGLAMDHVVHDRAREASRLASEYMNLVVSIGDPILTARVTPAALHIKYETGETTDVLPWAQTVIDLVENGTAGDGSRLGSPLAAALAARGIARFSLGVTGWQEDFDQAVTTARDTDPMSQAAVVNATYIPAIGAGVLLPDDDALHRIEEALYIAERAADDIALGTAQLSLGLALVHRGEPDASRGFEILSHVREMCLQNRFLLTVMPVLDLSVARQMTERGDFDAALPLLRSAAERLFERGHPARLAATDLFVQALLARDTEADGREAQAAIDRFAGCSAGDLATGKVLLLRLHALLAKAHRDEIGYRDYRDRYRALATSLGFEGHMAIAAAMQ